MWAAVVRKELRENRWKWLIFAAILIGTTILAQVMLGPLAEILTGAAGSEMAPLIELMRQQLNDPFVYHWSNWYAKNLYQISTVFAILVGMSAIAGEVNRGTAAFLFTRPMARRTILSAKVAAGFGSLALVVTSATVATMLISRLGETPLPARFLLGLPIALLGTLVLYLVTVVISILVNDPVKAGAASAGVLLLLSVPGWIKGWGSYSIYRQMAGVGLMLGESWSVLTAAVLAAISIAIYALAIVLLDRKEFSR